MWYFQRREGRSWRQLKVILEHLPPSSRYVEALANDPDYAARLADMPPQEGPTGPRLSEWTPELATLTEIKDGIAALWAVTVKAAGGKPPKIEPSPRPRTAVTAARGQRSKARHLSLVEEVKEAQRRWAEENGGVIR